MPSANARYGTPKPPQETDPFDGVLLVNKPAGPTSHDIVDKIRRTFKIRKVGHGGTLDPGATGLLILLLGRGTKLSSRIMGGDKTYAGTIELGRSTSTQDAEGEVLETGDCSAVTAEQLQSAMRGLRGDSYQMPPMVSAVKIGGVPLYKLARKGKTVEREPRLIHVYEFKLLSFESPCGDFRVRSTKGTYVRTLCHDVGQTLGCCAHMRTLCRTESGGLKLENAYALDTVLSWSFGELCGKLIPVRDFAG